MRPIDADTLMPNAEYKGANDVVSAYDIANAPTIDTEKHGRWLDRFVIPITCTSDIEFVQEAKCSNCRRWHERPYWYGGFTDYTYCPWCSAKMDEVKE